MLVDELRGGVERRGPQMDVMEPRRFWWADGVSSFVKADEGLELVGEESP